jgi:DNA repair protein RadC
MVEYKSMLNRYSLVKEPTQIKRAKLNSPQLVAEYARKFWEAIDVYESFYVLMLNSANNVIGFVKTGQGGVGSVVTDVKLIAKYAIDSLASAIIVLHNHPSGQMVASNGDRMITKKVKSAMELLDIQMIDHIILSPEDNKYYSFNEEGEI